MANMSNRFLADRPAPPDADDDDDNFNKLNLYFLLLLWALNMFALSLGLMLLCAIGALLFDRILLVLLFFTLLRWSVVTVCIELGLPRLTTTTDCALLVGDVDDEMELRRDGTCWGLDALVGLLMMPG